MAARKRKAKGWAGDRQHRYYFILNPYDDVGFTRCGQCGQKTKIRMFCLLIHIEPRNLLSLNKSCRFCARCEVIIVKKRELEARLVEACEQHWPEAVGNDYLVIGTLDRTLHRQGKAGTLETNEAIDAFTPFVDHLKFEVRSGWLPPDGK